MGVYGSCQITVENKPNKQFKRDSQRLAFLLLLQILCLWHNALGLGGGVVHPLIGRYVARGCEE